MEPLQRRAGLAGRLRPSDRVFSYDELRSAVGTFLDAEAAELGVATEPERDRELFRVFLRWLKTKPE